MVMACKKSVKYQDILSWYLASHLGQLSLANPLWVGVASTGTGRHHLLIKVSVKVWHINAAELVKEKILI